MGKIDVACYFCTPLYTLYNAHNFNIQSQAFKYGSSSDDGTGGRRSPAIACWASNHWVASSNPLRCKFCH